MLCQSDISLILAINQIGLAEGLALGKSLGIDPTLLHSVINTSSGQFAVVQNRLIDQDNPGHPVSTRHWQGSRIHQAPAAFRAVFRVA